MSSSQVVKSSPTATGIVDWNTIAPVMFPSARESFPRAPRRSCSPFRAARSRTARARATARAAPDQRCLRHGAPARRRGARRRRSPRARPGAARSRRHPGRIAPSRVEEQRLQRLLGFDRAAVPKRPRDVEDVRRDEQHRRDDLERLRRPEPDAERDDEAADEEARSRSSVGKWTSADSPAGAGPGRAARRRRPAPSRSLRAEAARR